MESISLIYIAQLRITSVLNLESTFPEFHTYRITDKLKDSRQKHAEIIISCDTEDELFIGKVIHSKAKTIFEFLSIHQEMATVTGGKLGY